MFGISNNANVKDNSTIVLQKKIIEKIKLFSFLYLLTDYH